MKKKLTLRPIHGHVFIWKSLAELVKNLNHRRRIQFRYIVCLMVLGGLAEIVSIGAVIPFLAVISDPKVVESYPRAHEILVSISVITSSEIIIAISCLFALSAVIAAAVRLTVIYFNQQFVSSISCDLSVAVFDKIMHQPYAYHIDQNSSDALANINKCQLVTSQILMPLIQTASAAVIGVAILIGLMILDPMITLGSGVSFALTYWLVMVATRATMLKNGKIVAQSQGERLRVANEGLGGIRDILLDQNQMEFVERFAAIEDRLNYAQAKNSYTAQAPRYIVEGVGIAIIALMACILSVREGELVTVLPVIGSFALGAQRLLPLMQQGYSGWAATLTAGPMLSDVIKILNLQKDVRCGAPNLAPLIDFRKKLVFSNVSFHYAQVPRLALQNINLVIPRGSRVGLAGRTGSGKSTLMDLALGMLSPSEGRILIDGIELNDNNRSSWQARVAHVPQSIYLSDNSICENIAFGIPFKEIDWGRVADSAAKAGLSTVISELPKGYDTFVGERGVKLSGGQRQRLGIARALYKKAEFLVFDEATSSLDTETESTVMSAIEKLGRDLTIIIIAHRMSTLDSCDFVVTLDAGRICKVEARN